MSGKKHDMWQHCENVLAVRLFEHLVWQDRYGCVHVEAHEPIHIVQGTLPADEEGELAVVDRIKRMAVSAYVCQDGMIDARWETAE